MSKKTSVSGSLITDFDEHVSIEKLNETVYWNTMPRTKTSGCGIYVLFNQKNIHYIGLAKQSLRERIKDHITDEHKGNWTHFSFYQTCDVKYVKDLETILLRIFNQPIGNKVSGHFATHGLSKRIEKNKI